jgi:Sec-independent protein secretion pathway component TatC
MPWGTSRTVTGIPLIVIVLVIIAAIFAAASVIFTPIWAVPLGIVIIGGVLASDAMPQRRTAGQQMADFRDEAKAEQVEFTERDKETLA